MKNNRLLPFVLLILAFLVSGCTSPLGQSVGQNDISLRDFERMPFDPEDVCPFECCEYMERYYDKFCPNGQVCVNNACVIREQAAPPPELPAVEDTAPENPIEPETEIPDTPSVPPSYSSASEASEIVFSHRLEGETTAGPFVSSTLSYGGHSSFKLIGVLQEIDPASTSLAKWSSTRVFELKNGRLEWNIDATETETSSLCTYTRILQSTGNEEISKLNIYYDASGNQTPLSGKGLVGSYSSNDWSYNAPRFSVDGEVLIPTDETTRVTLNQSNARCSGATENGSFTQKNTQSIRLPLVLVNFNDAELRQEDSAIVKERENNEQEITILSGNPNVRFHSLAIIMTSGNLTALGTHQNWDISWKLVLPPKN